MVQSDFDKEFRKKVLETFKFTIEFLESHNLRWWAAYGTCLGAVRHHGMIPWDDDIDIVMPREEYDKLIGVSSEMTERGYRFVTLRDRGNYIAFGKIIDESTTFVEHEITPIVSGIWVDVFPLDSFQKGDPIFISKLREFKKDLDCYHLSLHKYSLRLLCKNMRNGNFGSILTGLKALRYLSKKSKDKAFNNICLSEKELKQHNGDEYCDAPSYCAIGNRAFFPKEWVEDLIKVSFEDFEVKIPAKYDEYLKLQYKDYMTPPNPIPSSSHEMFYCNLKKRVSLSDVYQSVKNGQNKIY